MDETRRVLLYTNTAAYRISLSLQPGSKPHLYNYDTDVLINNLCTTHLSLRAPVIEVAV